MSTLDPQLTQQAALDKNPNWQRWLLLAFLVYVMLVAVSMIGSGFKYATGDHARELFNFASNPIMGLIIGMVSTALIQSSSTVTSIIVGMVTGGLPITIAVPMMMGANIHYDVSSHTAKARFSKNGDAHIWFPTYEVVNELILQSRLRLCRTIEFWHYIHFDGTSVVRDFPHLEMPVKRCPPRDMRSGGKPISIIVDFAK